MTVFGFHASHEQVPPADLLRAVVRAEQAGFTAAMCSDHFSPWSERQGESGFAWSWLGAALQATGLTFGVVNAPGQRYHPAIIAQAIGTLASMYPGRFWAALGTGEASNEHITGDPWPRKSVRNARLQHSVEVIRRLLRGEEVSHDGLITVDRARLWTLPDQPPQLIGAAASEQTAKWCATWADGLITVNADEEHLRRGMRVIADLVVNHTSNQHPWFQSARQSRESPYRDWYVWRDEPPGGGDKGIVFPDQETSLWEYDDEAGQYYLHRFYKHQPDLDIANPRVRAEIIRVIGFWLRLGLSGFRVDAVPFLLDTAGSLEAEVLPDPHDYLRDLRAFLSRRNGQAVLLGEVNLPYKETRQFFGDEDGDELTMCFDFIGMQKLYLSLARQDPAELVNALRERPDPPEEAQWGTFVRNHDELTLDKLTNEERNEVFAAFGPDESMQLYGRGLRRRLPTMLGNDRRRLRMVYSLLFSLPGTPVLFYGEEIGMGENLAAEGRNAVRTPMQWTTDANGGFSPADPDDLAAPVVEGDLSPEHVNVADQRRDPESLMNWTKLLIQRYRESPELSWGRCTILEHESPSAFAHRSDYEDGSVVALHNFSDAPAAVTLAVAGAGVGVRAVDLLRSGTTDVGADGTLRVELDAYDCRWLRIVRPGDRYVI